LIGIWILAATVLVNSYSGTVTSALTVPKMKKAVKPFWLALQIIFISNTYYEQSAQSGAFKTLGDQLRNHPERMHQTAGKSLLEKINTLKYAIPKVGYIYRPI